jgi:hypothetical protein
MANDELWYVIVKVRTTSDFAVDQIAQRIFDEHHNDFDYPKDFEVTIRHHHDIGWEPDQ